DYSSGSIIKQVSLPVSEARHVLITYRTNAFTSFTIEIVGQNGTYYPTTASSATNAPGKSVELYTQAFDLSPAKGNVESIRVWITNYDDRGYVGNLDLWIDSISAVKYVGSSDDMIALLERSVVKDPVSFYSSTLDVPKAVKLLNASGIPGATILSFYRKDPTSYSVVLQLTGPTLLVLSQAFSSSWNARIEGIVVQDHFRINRFANGWLISGSGRT